MTTLHDPAALPLVYPGPRVRREYGWCANWFSETAHPAGGGIGVPTFSGGGEPERCIECEKAANEGAK